MRIRDIIVGEDYCVTVPRKRELASDAEQQLADHSLTASVVLASSELLYNLPPGQHPRWGFRARVWPRACPTARPTLA
jgi:hypothetical protein